MSLWKYNGDGYRIHFIVYRFIYLFVYFLFSYSSELTFFTIRQMYIYINSSNQFICILLWQFSWPVLFCPPPGATVLCWHNSQKFTHTRRLTRPTRLQGMHTILYTSYSDVDVYASSRGWFSFAFFPFPYVRQLNFSVRIHR